MKDYVVYSKFKAQELIRQGFDLKNVKVNTKDQTKVVFFFENTPALQEALKQ